MRKIYFLLILILSSISTLANGTVFTIGKPDGSAGEFKFFRNLDDDIYSPESRKFRDIDGAKKFFANPPVFVVGKSKDSDWSFIHPIRACNWAGINESTELKIEFQAPRTNKKKLFLKIGLADTSERQEIGLNIKLNGKLIASKNNFYKDNNNPSLSPSCTLAFHKGAKNTPSKPCIIEINSADLKDGKNIISLEGKSPNWKRSRPQWLVYDFIELSTNKDYPEIPDYKKTLLERAIKSMGTEEVIFCVSGSSRGEHWYENIGRICEDDDPHPTIKSRSGAENFSRLGGRLVRYNIRTGEYKIILEDEFGGVRDPRLHYDAKKILFSYRKGKSDTFKLYEIDIDGKNLRKLPLNSDGNDIEPCYLPNDDIMFCSDRKRRTVQCWMTPVANLHRYFAKENVVRVMSGNPDVDNTPNLLRDGRVLYMRWDYNHRNQVKLHHLWAINPDGSNNTIFYGNAWEWGVFLNAKQAPDSEDIIMAMSHGHGRKDHKSAIARLTPPFDPSNQYALKFIRPESKYHDPFPLKNQLCITTDDRDIFIIDYSGVSLKIPLPEELFATTQKAFRTKVLDNRDLVGAPCKMIARNVSPIMKTPRENIRPDMADYSKKTSAVFLQDVYIGRNMKGVKRGSVKKLLILQVQPTPVNYSGGYYPTGFSGSFALEEILGTVPVYEDGSAFFEVPANVGIAFVALDENNKCVKRMMSSTNFAPATQTSCIGCHEHRTEAPIRKQKLPIAYRKAISKIQKIEGINRIVDYTRDIQPIIDRYCVECHNSKNPNGSVILSMGVGVKHISPRLILQACGMFVTDNNLLGDFPPYTFGSGGSKIVRFAEGEHHNEKFSEKDMNILKAWLDIGAPHISTYAAKGTCFPFKRLFRVNSTLMNQQKMNKFFAKNCASCHQQKNDKRANFVFDDCFLMSVKLKDGSIKNLNFPREALYNFINPEDSPALIVPLAKSAGGSAGDNGNHPVIFKDKNSPDFQELLTEIKEVANRLDKERPFITSKNFFPAYGYVRKMQECGILPKDWNPKTPLDPFEIDQKYFRFQEKP